MWDNDELEYYTDPDTGDRMVRMVIGSNMLPHITVDTYSTFTTDSHEEMEVSYFEDEMEYDLSDGWGRDYDFDCDFSRFLTQLAEQCVHALSDNGYDPNPFTVGEVLNTRSPAAYNFATDSFEAEYALNMSQLIRWGSRAKRDGSTLEEWVDAELRTQFASYSGFHSYVIPALDGEYRGERLATLVWGLFYLWMELEFNEEEWFNDMFEGFTEICMDTITFRLTEEGWEKNKARVVTDGNEWMLPDDEDVKAEYAAFAAERDKYRQEESLF